MWTRRLNERLALRTPVGRAVELTLTSGADGGATAGAGSIGASVDPQTAASAWVTPSGDAVGTVGLDVFEQKTLRSADQRAQLGVIERCNRGPGMNALDEQDFAFVDVADAGQCALI